MIIACESRIKKNQHPQETNYIFCQNMPQGGLFLKMAFYKFIKKKKRLPSSFHDKERWQATSHFLTGNENSQKPPSA